jgi:hypothetical protein
MVNKYISRDRVARESIEYQERLESHFMNYWLKTRTKFLNLIGPAEREKARPDRTIAQLQG